MLSICRVRIFFALVVKLPPFFLLTQWKAAQSSIVVIEVMKKCLGNDVNAGEAGPSDCDHRPAGMRIDVHKDPSLMDGMKWFKTMEM